MLNIGCHLSVSKGFENMGKEALSIDANKFQFFTRNPRGGKAKQLDQNDIDMVIIAGDIYDTSNPPAAAEKLFYKTICKLQTTEIDA